jgi:hypothetical protein
MILRSRQQLPRPRHRNRVLPRKDSRRLKDLEAEALVDIGDIVKLIEETQLRGRSLIGREGAIAKSGPRPKVKLHRCRRSGAIVTPTEEWENKAA